MRIGLLLAGVLSISQALAAQTLPGGPGADVLKSRCVSCHESDIITSQKLTLTGWSNSINKMVRWGSQITPDERAVLQPYLATHFAPPRQASGGQAPALVASHATGDSNLSAPAAAEAGAVTYKRQCQTCHDTDIIEQQRLSRTGWTRTVEKMMRWGAQLTDADKEPLVDYLASRFPAR